jgi:hypothetical protein
VDDSDFIQSVEEFQHDLEDDDSDFILESEHSSQSEQSARDNENDLELAVGGND